MQKRALLLGAFEKTVDGKKQQVLTPAAAKFDNETDGRLSKTINV